MLVPAGHFNFVEAPAVTVLMPFRNAARTLPDCLESVLSQTLRDFELVAVDDGSEDDSANLLQQAAQKEARIRVIRPGPIGLVASLNLGMEESRTQFVARMDADDLMKKDRLQLQFDFLCAHPNIALVASRVELFPKEEVLAGYLEYIRWQDQCHSPEEIADNIYVESPFAHPSVMFRREVVRSLGGYRDGNFPEDYDLWLRIAETRRPMAKLPEVLLSWREGANRMSRINSRYAREAFDELRAHYLSRDPRLHSGREIVIWGAGRKTRARAGLLLDRGIHNTAWIDIDPKKIGQTLMDRPVYSPEWLDRTDRPFVLVYVTNHGARDLIAAKLQSLGYVSGQDYLAVG